MRPFVRLIALIVSLSATGPSSALALCVAACPPENAAQSTGARGNACHDQDQDPTETIGRGGMGCPHSPAATLAAGELAREERLNGSLATPTAGVPQLVGRPQIAAVIQFGSFLTTRSAPTPLVLRI